jgi:hypothetical protein
LKNWGQFIIPKKLIRKQTTAFHFLFISKCEAALFFCMICCNMSVLYICLEHPWLGSIKAHYHKSGLQNSQCYPHSKPGLPKLTYALFYTQPCVWWSCYYWLAVSIDQTVWQTCPHRNQSVSAADAHSLWCTVPHNEHKWTVGNCLQTVNTEWITHVGALFTYNVLFSLCALWEVPWTDEAGFVDAATWQCLT